MTYTMNSRSISKESGFTLLEMIVAVTLVAMMAVGLWAVFRISIRSWSRGTEFIDANQRHRSILDMVRKQLASAYPLIYTPADMQQGVAPYLVFSGSENSLRFVSLNSLQFQESPGLTLVSYEVAQDSTGDYSLVEKETRYTGQLPDNEVLALASKATPIFEDLSSCVFEYFGPSGDTDADTWVREWNGQERQRLPVAVSMTMISRDPRGNSVNRHMVIPVQAQANSTPLNIINPFGGRRVVMR